jgi:RNA recognition motif-containing protein
VSFYSSASSLSSSSSYYSSDPYTTNLIVSNLSPIIDEKVLALLFAKYGRLTSVKIMWPWTEEEKVFV